MRDRERKLILKIEKSLKRLEDGEYGTCERCGEQIGVARLKARPMTTLCIDCKSSEEIEERKYRRLA
jgi:DnaK suppressor protein